MSDQGQDTSIRALDIIQQMNAMSEPLPPGYPIDSFANVGVTGNSGQSSGKSPVLPRIKTALNVHHMTNAYSNALHNYLDAVLFPASQLPPCLNNPLAYFFSRKGHAKEIFSFEPFPYGNWSTTKVSQRTFPSLLRYYNIPDGPQDLRNDLFTALQELVRKYPYNERDLLLKEVIRVTPAFAQFLNCNLAVSPERNVYFRHPDASFAHPHSVFPYESILSPQFPAAKDVRKSLLKQYLSCVAKNPSEIEKKEHLSLPPKSILYYGSDPDQTFRSLSYSSGFTISEQLTPQLPIKALPYLNPPMQVPPGAATHLFHLTGGDTEKVDQLARLMARAAAPSPDGANMTVVCTRENSEALKALLQEVLSPLIFTLPTKKQGTLPSLNQFCRAGGLLKLYCAQGTGQGITFVRDIDVSDTARPVLKKLLTGKSIILSEPDFPKQHLSCKTHFICISQDPQRARTLSQSFKAHLIDLSSVEFPSRSLEELSAKDIAWLRSVFLPFGLVDDEKVVKAEKAPEPPDWTGEFLTKYCSVQPDGKCHREELYNAYAAFYRHTHPGLEPPLTAGRLVKAVKPYLGTGPLREVSYQKIRNEQKMYFVGLACPTSLPEPAPIPEHKHSDAFTSHLEEIHARRPSVSLSSHMQVKVIQAPADSMSIS